LGYQLDRLLEDLRALPGHPGPGRVSAAEKVVLEAWTALRLVETGQLARGGNGSRRTALHEFLVGIEHRLHVAADALAAERFTATLPQRSLATPTDPRAARASHRFLP
jgi:hypothetical protein